MNTGTKIAIAAAIGGLLGVLAYGARAEERTPTIVANYGQVQQDMSLVIMGEQVFDNVDDCWKFADEFNAEANAQGFIAFCWPSYANTDVDPSKPLVQS
jgi:hypothetical protein